MSNIAKYVSGYFGQNRKFCCKLWVSVRYNKDLGLLKIVIILK